MSGGSKIMGAWSVDPLGNDEAQEWIVNSIITPVLAAITETQDRFLADAELT
jgi:hypothetical protein